MLVILWKQVDAFKFGNPQRLIVAFKGILCKDIDMSLFGSYCDVIGYSKGSEKYLRENGYIFQQEDFNGNMRNVVSGAAILMFGNNPEFCWKELIVNAICHRDYSILGTDIQIKIFDDHITVESPGIFPGIVRPSNIREIHFSRNPKIAAYMHAYEFVKEFGEGVDRMYRELEEGGYPEPSFSQVAFMIKATIWERKPSENAESDPKVAQSGPKVAQSWPDEWPEPKRIIIQTIESDFSISVGKMEDKLKIGHTTIKKYLKELQDEGIIRRVGNKRSGHLEIIK